MAYKVKASAKQDRDYREAVAHTAHACAQFPKSCRRCNDEAVAAGKIPRTRASRGK